MAGAGGPDDDGGPGGVGEAGAGAGLQGLQLQRQPATAILTLLNLAQKVPFLEDLKKKVSKSDWNQRHIVYVTQIHYYTWF